MFNKRLLNAVPGIRKNICVLLGLNICTLLVNIFMNYKIAVYINKLLMDNGNFKEIAVSILSAVILNIIMIYFKSIYSHNVSQRVKLFFRNRLFNKFYSFGLQYTEKASSSEIVQLAVGGIEQLDMYYGRFMPQLVYSMIAPVILFIFLSFYSIRVAFVLFIFVPLIPISIMMVQKIAKKTMASYWKSFVNLSDTFLDNLQGLTILKVYNSDEYKNETMNNEAEKFRRATMKVLSVQLNNINVMDLIAYGGSAIGIVYSLNQYKGGFINLTGAILFILLSVEFFLPLRLLGSFFHVAMNGMAAADRMFEILDMEEFKDGEELLNDAKVNISIKNLSFAYENDKELLNNINMEFPAGTFTTIVGESGCGKSTIADLIMGIKSGYSGKILFNNKNDNFKKESKLMSLTLIDNNPYLFEGSVRYNLKMGKKEASDEEMWKVLKLVALDKFLLNENGLDTKIKENGSNLSGGQKQRLGVARALLKNSKVYILDEATSNIDIESEDIIIELFQKLKKDRTVIFISHRLKSSQKADRIYMIKDKIVKESGDFKSLITAKGDFCKMYETQTALENYGGN